MEVVHEIDVDSYDVHERLPDRDGDRLLVVGVVVRVQGNLLVEKFVQSEKNGQTFNSST